MPRRAPHRRLPVSPAGNRLPKPASGLFQMYVVNRGGYYAGAIHGVALAIAGALGEALRTNAELARPNSLSESPRSNRAMAQSFVHSVDAGVASVVAGVGGFSSWGSPDRRCVTSGLQCRGSVLWQEKHVSLPQRFGRTIGVDDVEVGAHGYQALHRNRIPDDYSTAAAHSITPSTDADISIQMVKMFSVRQPGFFFDARERVGIERKD